MTFLCAPISKAFYLSSTCTHFTDQETGSEMLGNLPKSVTPLSCLVA